MPYSRFNPPALIRNVHLQNVLSTSSIRRNLLARRYTSLLSSAKSIILDAGNGVKLSALLNRQPASRAPKLVILLHGWEGSARSAYITSMAGALYSSGFDTLRINFRDHGGSHHLNRGIFNSTLIDEVVGAIEYAINEYSYSTYSVAGFSLGGNFALRYSLRNKYLKYPASAILSICPVLDPTHTMAALESNWSLYEQYFVKKWKRSLEAKLAHFPDYDYRDELNKMQTLKQMNEYFIPRYTGYESVERYFQSYTLTGDALSLIDTPTLIITSKDDPINPFSDFEKIAMPQKLQLLTTDYGSHCAFLKNMHLDSWADDIALDFFDLSQ